MSMESITILTETAKFVLGCILGIITFHIGDAALEYFFRARHRK